MIKIQKEDFNSEIEIEGIKNLYSNIGASTSFVGYVRDNNNNNGVQSINIEVYKEMAHKQLDKIINKAKLKWQLLDCLIIHRYGKLDVNSKIVLVSCFSEHRKDSFESCSFIMDYLKKDAPLWKNEFYDKNNEWLENSN
ncbi:MAG: molybdenum cofactor biosynthesis protein MoaE [Pelagibacteraceae bacterium]|jgi:molybdopterin synthase catalytic subunit|nr:molybdenum cofactor biosynthesis protein MoaE [Pelagibacteraceae bacterium]MBT3901889.1 molybdenum cofactor biosynthesis protein MoaE [Pelagibacteraceae bacterium]MBT4950318.1 molybdenum cofactor biosynthesis protein MoaE [Pelagibacteraceae bacterium]MBT6354169.1 molybdenum cofactor biosynthesis protein MoaE [Pelagibacteraceae bacterium]